VLLHEVPGNPGKHHQKVFLQVSKCGDGGVPTLKEGNRLGSKSTRDSMSRRKVSSITSYQDLKGSIKGMLEEFRTEQNKLI
jgi:ribosomal protein S3AE